jgi:hypothetical protein
MGVGEGVGVTVAVEVAVVVAVGVGVRVGVAVAGDGAATIISPGVQAATSDPPLGLLARDPEHVSG